MCTCVCVYLKSDMPQRSPGLPPRSGTDIFHPFPALTPPPPPPLGTAKGAHLLFLRRSRECTPPAETPLTALCVLPRTNPKGRRRVKELVNTLGICNSDQTGTCYSLLLLQGMQCRVELTWRNFKLKLLLAPQNYVLSHLKSGQTSSIIRVVRITMCYS